MSSVDNNDQIISLQRVKERLLSTSNDQLPNVLKVLLPRLLQLLDDSSIRNKVIEVLSEIMKRLKTIVSFTTIENSSDDSYSLIISELLKLVSMDLMPFTCNFAITFLDIILGTPVVAKCNNNKSGEILVEKLAQFETFSNQSNSLCNYLLYLLDEVLKSTNNIQNDSITKDIIGDFLLDICLSSKSFQKDMVGSIQSGLSEKRVARLCIRKKEWKNEDLSRMKKIIISNFSYSIIINESLSGYQEKLKNKIFLPAKYCVAMSIILSCDPDMDVSTQATFKMNGAMNLFHVNNIDDNEEKKIHSDILIYLFGLCSSSTNNSYARSSLRIDVRCAILRFICKEMSKYLAIVSKNVIELVFSTVFNPEKSVVPASHSNLLCNCMSLAELFLKNNNDSNLLQSSLLFIQCSKKILLSYSSSSTNLSNSNDDLNLSIRTSCYNIIDIVARNNNYSVDDTDLVILLFQLLDSEDERIIPRLYTALGGLRLAHQNSVESHASTITDKSSLFDLIINARKSSDSKKRLASFQWARALFGWQSITMDTLILLADDSNEVVRDAVKSEFSKLEVLIAKDNNNDEYEYLLKNLLQTLINHNHILVIDNTNKSKISALYMVLKIISIGLNKRTSNKNYYYDDLFFSLSESSELVKKMHNSSWDNEFMIRIFDCICKIRIILDALLVNTSALFLFKDESIDDNLFFSSFSPVDNLMSNNQVSSYPIIHIIRYIISILHDMLLINKNNEIVINSIRDNLTPFLFGLLKYSEKTIRINLAESFSILCHDGTPNYIMNIFRLCQNKLINKLSDSVRDDAIVKSGALYIVGHVAAVIISYYFKTESENQSKDENQLLNLLEVRKIYEFVINIISNHITSLSKTVVITNNSFSFEDKLNIVVSLEVYQSFARNGYLNIDNRRLYFDKNQILPSPDDSHLVRYASLLQNFNKFSIITSHSIDMNSFIEDIKLLLTSKESFIISNGITLLSQLAILTDSREILWVDMFKKDLQDIDNTIVRFSLSEAIVKITISDVFYRKMSNSIDIQMGKSFISQLLKCVKDSLYSLPSNDALNHVNRKSLSVLVLVLVQKNRYFKLLEEENIKFCLEVLLKLLKDNDGFIQDICCLGICHIYKAASEESGSTSASNNRKLVDYIMNEVINALTREKRIQQPAGYSVAGESVTASVAADNTNNGEDNIRAPVGVPINRSDPLALAAASAALELGISLDNPPTNNQRDPSENDYGVYRIVCKVAKKTGDPAILFAVLSLIRRDPTFGIHLTEVIYNRYKAPFNEIDPSKINHLLPMLYIARFDPTIVVRDVMRLLWDKLIPIEQQKKLLLHHHKAILNHLSLHLTSSSWKERESACLALEAFIPKKDWTILKPYVRDLWLKGMKVIDDVRISIRMASLNFMKVLSDSIIRSCNPDETALLIVNETIDFFVPLLIKEGLIASSAEARGFCLGILLKVVQTAKRHLYKWLPELVSVLVESMSALEPRTLQYMQFHTARLQISEEELENMRIKMSQTSPMQESLTYCLQSLNEVTIPTVVSELCRHIKSGVGLSTRVAAVESISYLVERYPHDLGIHSVTAFETIIKSLIHAPQMTVSLKKAMMSGIGALAKVVNTEALGMNCDFLVKKYNCWDRNDIDQCKVIAGCIDQIVRKGGERIVDEEVWIPLLTCIYIGCFDSDTEAMESWTKVWNESALSNSGTGTKYSALRKIFQSLIPTVNNFLIDLSWNRRIQGVNVIKDLISNLEYSIFSNYISSWVYILFHSVPGQIWSGQGVVLEILSDIVSKCRDNIIYDININNKIEPLMIINHKADIESITIFAHTDDNNIAFKKNENFESIIQNSSIDMSKFDWKINIIEFCQFLINECLRGNKDYRMSASKSLSLLPWTYITSKNPLIYFKLLPVLCEKVGIFLLSDNNSYSEIKEFGNNRDRLNNNQIIKVDIVRKEKNNKLSNSSIFGIRYGSDLFNKKSRISTTTIINDNEEEISDFIMNESNSEQNIILDSNSMDVIDTVVEECHISIESKPSESDISNNDDNINNKYLEIEIIYSKIMDSTDPAYRMLFIDSINRGWPNNSSNSVDINTFYSSLGYNKSKVLVELVNWSLFIFYLEAWSVRKSAVMMIGNIGQSIDIENEVEKDLLEKIMIIIQKGLEEEKYIQIKVESLKSLDKLLNSKLKSILNDNYFEAIRGIIRKSSEDTKPSVLESVAKLQESWLR